MDLTVANLTRPKPRRIDSAVIRRRSSILYPFLRFVLLIRERSLPPRTPPLGLTVKLFVVLLLAALAVQTAVGVGGAASAGLGRTSQPEAGAVPLLCSNAASQKYCDLRVILLIDDTGSMRSNDPLRMRAQGAKNLVDILDQEYYRPALDARARDASVVLPDVQVAVIHFSHCTSTDSSDHCSQDVKYNTGWLPITRKDDLYAGIDWLNTQPDFYRVPQYTHFVQPFQAAVDLFNRPEAQSGNDCVHRLVLLLTDGTPEDVHGPLNEPDLGTELRQVGTLLKGFLSQADDHVYVTAFKILPRYWGPAEPYWQQIAGAADVSLESTLDDVANRMEKITAANIGAQSSTLSPDPQNPRLYRIDVLHHVQSLRITYYKLDPNAALTLSDSQGQPLLPDGTTVTRTGQGTSIEVWTLTDPPAGTLQLTTSQRGGIITTIPLYALSLQLEAPVPSSPLLQFASGDIRFKLLDDRDQPVLPADDSPDRLTLQASLTDPAGQVTPLSLTQAAQDYQAGWTPVTTQSQVLHLKVSLADAAGNSLWKCEGDGGDLPVAPLGVNAGLPPDCVPVNAPTVLPLQLVNAQTGQNVAIALPVQWQAASVTVPGGQAVASSVSELDAKTGSYHLTIQPVLPEKIQTHLTASVLVNGASFEFYSGDVTTAVCPVLPPSGPSCRCGGYWNELLWSLLVALVVILLLRRLFRARRRSHRRDWLSWLLLALLILLGLAWILVCCNIPIGPLLLLLLILILALLLIRVIARDEDRKPSYRLLVLAVLLFGLLLVWAVFFGGTWLYLFLMLLVLLAGLAVLWIVSLLRNKEEPYPSWILLVLLIALISVWMIFFGQFPFWLALILLGSGLIFLLLVWSLSRSADWRRPSRLWLLAALWLVLILAWLIFFSGSWIYLIGLLVVLLLILLAAWLVVRYRNPLWGVVGIVDRRNRVLWSSSLAKSAETPGRSFYNWWFEEPICSVRRIRIHSWDQRAHWLVLVVTTLRRRQYFRRNLNKWQDCVLGDDCRIVWQPKAAEARPPRGRKPPASSGRRPPRTKRYDIERIEGIGPVYAARFKQAGIHTPQELLKAAGSRRGRRALAGVTGFSLHQILEWVNRADLMRVPGVGEEYSDLLEASGVDTVKELRRRNPGNLCDQLRQVNARKHLTRRVPTPAQVAAWIAAAQKMNPMVT